MYQRILVPIDSIHTADRALLELPKLTQENSEVILLYVLEDIYPLDVESYSIIDYTQLQQAVNETGQRALAQAASKLSQLGIAHVHTELLQASPSQHIVDLIQQTAQNQAVDLIVLGTHGRKGLNRLLLGSIAEAVVRNADVPVLLLKQN